MARPPEETDVPQPPSEWCPVSRRPKNEAGVPCVQTDSAWPKCPSYYSKPRVLHRCHLGESMQTKTGWVGKAPDPNPFLGCASLAEKDPAAVFGPEDLQSQAWHQPLPMRTKVPSWRVKEPASVRNWEARRPLISTLWLRTPCPYELCDVSWLGSKWLMASMPPKRGKVPGTQQLGKGVTCLVS